MMKIIDPTGRWCPKCARKGNTANENVVAKWPAVYPPTSLKVARTQAAETNYDIDREPQRWQQEKD